MAQAVLNATLLDDGGEACQCRFGYGLTPALGSYSPDVAGITTGMAFSFTLTGLANNTTYYFQAEATNSAGTSVGAVLSFTTLVALPAVTTVIPATDIHQHSAVLGGILDDDGGEPCVIGVQYSKDQEIWTILTHDTSERSPFSFSPTPGTLDAGVLYYFRAFATNSAGTAYGALGSFTTLPILPPIYPPPPAQGGISYLDIFVTVGGMIGLAMIISGCGKKKKKKGENGQNGQK